jgi:hypothetical protein
MSKYNSLLEKAELFEKLALYGSKKDFLSKISESTVVENNKNSEYKNYRYGGKNKIIRKKRHYFN